MRRLTLICSLWLAAGCGVARESLGELSQAGKGGRKREVIVAGSGGSAGEQRDPGRDAGQPAAGGGGGDAPAAGSGGWAAPLDAGRPFDECAANGCNAAAQPLEGYCGLEHARCPMLLGSGRSRACDPALKSRGPAVRSIVERHAVVSNTCGGQSVLTRLTYGTVEYHYGADEKLRAVSTTTPSAGGPCNATVYRYGDVGCAPAGDPQEIGCAE